MICNFAYRSWTYVILTFIDCINITKCYIDSTFQLIGGKTTVQIKRNIKHKHVEKDQLNNLFLSLDHLNIHQQVTDLEIMVTK